MNRSRLLLRDGSWLDLDKAVYRKSNEDTDEPIPNMPLIALKYICQNSNNSADNNVSRASIYNKLYNDGYDKSDRKRMNKFNALISRIKRILGDNFVTKEETVKILFAEGEMIYDSGLDYFKDNTKEFQKIKSIDICSHTGSMFLSKGEYIKKFEEFKEERIPIRILLNTPAVSQNICRHFFHHDKAYPYGAETPIQRWREFQEKNCGNVEIRISEIPFLHSYYCIHYRKKEAIASIAFYSYGVPYEQLFRETYKENEPNFNLFQSEFLWLWNHDYTYSINRK